MMDLPGLALEGRQQQEMFVQWKIYCSKQELQEEINQRYVYNQSAGVSNRTQKPKALREEHASISETETRAAGWNAATVEREKWR